MRVPGFSARNRGASIFIMFGETYNVMTVACPRSASNKSPDNEGHAVGDFRLIGNPPGELDQTARQRLSRFRAFLAAVLPGLLRPILRA
jgi:hypothetical protein